MSADTATRTPQPPPGPDTHDPDATVPPQTPAAAITPGVVAAEDKPGEKPALTQQQIDSLLYMTKFEHEQADLAKRKDAVSGGSVLFRPIRLLMQVFSPSRLAESNKARVQALFVLMVLFVLVMAPLLFL